VLTADVVLVVPACCEEVEGAHGFVSGVVLVLGDTTLVLGVFTGGVTEVTGFGGVTTGVLGCATDPEPRLIEIIPRQTGWASRAEIKVTCKGRVP
jgi:hypothetical protein